MNTDKIKKYIYKNYPDVSASEEEQLIMDALEYYKPFHSEMAAYSIDLHEYFKNGRKKIYTED